MSQFQAVITLYVLIQIDLDGLCDGLVEKTWIWVSRTSIAPLAAHPPLVPHFNCMEKNEPSRTMGFGLPFFDP